MMYQPLEHSTNEMKLGTCSVLEVQQLLTVVIWYGDAGILIAMLQIKEYVVCCHGIVRAHSC